MAGIQPIDGVRNMPVITPQDTAPRTDQAASKVNNQPADQTKIQDAPQDKDRKDSVPRTETELENVVAVSKDGDTVQVKPEDREGLVTAQGKTAEEAQKTPAFKTEEEKETPEEQVEKMQEAISTALQAMQKEPETNREQVLEQEKEDAVKAAEKKAEEKAAAEKKAEEKEAAEEKAQEKAEAKDQPPQSYTGMSDQQIEQLYEKGTINRYDYEQEMAKREDLKENQTGDNEKISKEMTEAAAEMNEAANAAETIENAYGENAEEPEAARVRVQAMEALSTATAQNQ